MSQNLEELHALVRSLRTEIEWAARIGIEVSPPSAEALPDLPPPVEGEGGTGPKVAEPPIPSPFARKVEATPERRAVKPPPKREGANPRRPWEAYMPEPGSEPAPPPEPPPPVEARPEPAAPPHPVPAPELPPPVEAAPPEEVARPREPAPPPVEASPPAEAAPVEPAPAPAPVEAAPRPRPAFAPLIDHVPAPGTSALPIVNLELGTCAQLEDVQAVLGPCVRCKLHKQGRKKIVFGVGDPQADVMFVGEGPGGDEDRIGEPFVGKAGQLLTRIIEGGMKLRREDVYIANIVKCRPPQNRDPQPDEVAACEPFLLTQIRIIQPKVIVALGKYAAQTLLRSDTSISRLRGQWHHYNGIPLMPTFHPSYLLRNPEQKRPVWEDIQTVMRLLATPVSGPEAQR